MVIVNPFDGAIVVLRIPVQSFEIEVPVPTQVLVVESEAYVHGRRLVIM